MSNWRPLPARYDPEKAREYDALHDGVPPWLEQSLAFWCRERITSVSSLGNRSAVAAERLRALERALRIRLVGGTGNLDAAMSQLRESEELLLSAADFLARGIGAEEARELEEYLNEAGSVWRVAGRPYSWELQRKVSPEIEGVLRSLGERPGDYLRQAWQRAFSRNPNPDGAYRDAVRALEAVLRPVVSPKNDRATLGSMIRDLKSKLEKWAVRLEPSEGDPVETFADELQMIWTAQLDRHGTDDESVPLNVTPEQAQDAVVRATALVHVVQSGGFKLR